MFVAQLEDAFIDQLSAPSGYVASAPISFTPPENFAMSVFNDRSLRKMASALLLCGLSQAAGAEVVGIKHGLGVVRARCGYDLTELKPYLIAANVESFSSSGIAITFRLKSKIQAQPVAAQLSINCAVSPSNSERQGEVFPDARAVIQEEDAGERYFQACGISKTGTESKLESQRSGR